ncbi:MAG: diaminopimelate epimerase [Oscillospiraceae bacterium]|nr:diaminopimelate epimerase [Oscillospiraceae bacterium]
MNYLKMHGAGNSFAIVENLHGELEGTDLNALARCLCSPETGPGADGMIVVAPGPEDADFSMLFYNSDGTLGEMCGNGARCIARYGVEHCLSPDPEHIRFRATAGPIAARRITEEQYEVKLNNPSVIDLNRIAEADGQKVSCAYVELGDPGIPHAVTEVSAGELDKAFEGYRVYARGETGAPTGYLPLRELGRQLRYSDAFPKGANVTFFTRIGEAQVRAITFERGVEDFTLACGTGCGATAVSLMLRRQIPGDTLEIIMPGGVLTVMIRQDENGISDVFLTGPTAVVESGEFSV